MKMFKNRAVQLSALALILATLTACADGKNEVPTHSMVGDNNHTQTTHDSPNNQNGHAEMNHAHMNHSAMAMDTQNAPPHTQAYLAMMNKMGDEMSKAGNLADADTAFAKGMIPHHIGAVEMAKVQLEFGKDETMRKLAQAIIDGQQAEIDLMNGWLNGKDTTTQNANAPHAKAYALDNSHSEMMTAIYETDPDVAFAKAMIPHHQGAVEMAKVQLQFGKDEKMKKLAQDIIKAQEPEIKLMQDWLKQ
ncbi:MULTISPECIES: DUF305 domain-containing protein [Pseudomonadota]|uniref:DUF305 domain-containing protein n=1 Tax=Conchiformibius steedae TaxID=153493 RepID=A0A3P2A0J8_9NEIS|nr:MULTISPECIES: DUF305 domain-containing protein [Pseudomonadota]RRD88819.1 DUF305 domain-containing protein [Conchiformibius steedae]TWV84639.1 DUF305 domain-containing protein [Moraxella sp. VT-16-12]